MGDSTVFVSYRRQLSWALAHLVYRDLRNHGFDAFIDVENIDSGEFDQKILREIEARTHFIVLLQPGSLDSIGDERDWLRREIAHALAHERNVVPMIADGFEFSGDLALPLDVARLPKFNAVSIPPGYFDTAMERLRTRFLKSPLPSASSFGSVLRVSKPKGVTPTFTLPLLPAPRLSGSFRGRPIIRLTWSKVSGASEYSLERANIGWAHRDIGADKEFRQLYRGPDRTSNDMMSGTFPAWQYRVCAIDGSGQFGTWSEPMRVTMHS